MRRLRKKRNGRPVNRRQDESDLVPDVYRNMREADLVAQACGFRDMHQMRHKKLWTRRQRARDKWQRKWEPVEDKYIRPRKLRGEERETIWWVLCAIRIIEDYPQYFDYKSTFWDDLKKSGGDFPSDLPGLLDQLSLEPSELLRAIADFIDALKAPKGDRGARLQATHKLYYEYAYPVLTGEAKKRNWRELKAEFCTYYEDDENWVKFLKVRGIPFHGVGRARQRGAVQNRKKNTARRVCVRMTRDHQSRRDLNNAENGSRPRR